MKGLLLLSIILLASCGKSKANSIGTSSCTVSPAHGECVLTNNTQLSLSCRFDSDARTLHGFPIWVRRSVFLYPGMQAWNYANAFNPVFDPIVSMTSSFDCKEVK